MDIDLPGRGTWSDRRHASRGVAGRRAVRVLPVLAAAVFLASCAYDPAKRDNGWAHKRPAEIHVPVREALEDAKDVCVRDTGESKTPGFWAGYSSKFMACMNAHGWIRVSSPL